MKKTMAMLLLLTMVSTSLIGCGKDDVKKPETDKTEDQVSESVDKEIDLSDITIGATVMSLQHEFMANLVVGYEEFAKQTGVNLLITDGGNMEPEKQVTNVENYVVQNVDGILAQCISVETMKDTLKNALDKDIPVGIYPYDTSVGATTYFGYNEYEWGYSLGEAAHAWIEAELGGEAKILNVITSLEETAVERSQGWIDAINELTGEENVEWVTVEATSSEDAISAVESSLQAHPDTKMVLVYNDEMGIGAYEAIIQSGLETSDMFLGSCDGTDTVLDYVQEDTVYRCTVGNDRFVTEIGYHWVQNMVKIVLGMEYDDPFPIETTAITLDNVEAYRAREPQFVLDEDLIEFVNNK